MTYKTSALSWSEAKTNIIFLVFLGTASVLPALVHSQWLTGPIINALLIISLVYCGIKRSLLLALIPSTVALASGLLPALLAPVVPFIMIANVILLLALDYFMKHNKYWLGLVIGATLKFVFLLSSVTIISSLLYKKELAVAVANMMSWPQLFTALIGGALAWGFIRKFKI